jgi:hypothetical protein
LFYAAEVLRGPWSDKSQEFVPVGLALVPMLMVFAFTTTSIKYPGLEAFLGNVAKGNVLNEIEIALQSDVCFGRIKLASRATNGFRWFVGVRDRHLE